MKLLGLSFGRKMQSTEVLVREALMGAEESGVEVAMIRSLDLDIRPCTGCVACAMSLFEGGAGKCVLKDDLGFLDEQLMECDGLILGAPVYVLGPPGLLKVISDRFGPSHDVAFRIESKKIRAAKGKDPEKGPDERSFRKRVAGFISVGGASTPHWLSLGLPLMHLFTFPSHIKVVDQMQINSISKYMNVVLNPEAIARARKLGQNVALAMRKPIEEVTWMGDDEGICPVCHSALLTVFGRNPVQCPICGIEGTLKTEGDKITVTFKEEEQARSRLTIAGKKEHFDELRENFGGFMQRPDKDEIPKRLEKYESYNVPVLTPQR